MKFKSDRIGNIFEPLLLQLYILSTFRYIINNLVEDE